MNFFLWASPLLPHLHCASALGRLLHCKHQFFSFFGQCNFLNEGRFFPALQWSRWLVALFVWSFLAMHPWWTVGKISVCHSDVLPSVSNMYDCVFEWGLVSILTCCIVLWAFWESVSQVIILNLAQIKSPLFLFDY